MPEPYSTPAGVEAAIKHAAKKAANLDPALDVNRRINLEYFDRFLSRVFSEGEGSEWLLKGGTGMLNESTVNSRHPGHRPRPSQATTAKPANTLGLPRLISNPYRLYPIVDQIADKVCATMTDYGQRSSSREKDLVDLVVFATTHDIDGGALAIAIETEARRRQMKPLERFIVPSSWGAGYAKLAKPIPYCTDHATVTLAAALVTRVIDPALDGSANGKTWSRDALGWI